MSENDTPEWVGFGYSEIAFLLSQMEGIAAEKARSCFDFQLSVYSSEVLGAGLSSLFARSLVVHGDGDAVLPEGAAALLAVGVDGARIWSKIAFLGDGDVLTDSALMLAGGEITILLQPRNFGSWVMMVKAPERSDGQALMELARSFFDADPDGSVLVSAETSRAQRAALFSVDGSGWSVTTPGSESGDAQITVKHDESSALASLESLLAFDSTAF